MPIFPLTTWRGKYNLPLDAVYTFIGLLLLGILISHFFKLLSKKQLFLNVKEEWLFSLIFLSEMFVFILLFQKGSMYNLNRYIGATSFFAFFLIPFMQSFKLTKKHLLTIGGLMITTWASFGAFYGQNDEQLIFFLLFVVLSLYSILWIKGIVGEKKWVTYLLILVNLVIQIHYYHMFLSGRWVG